MINALGDWGAQWQFGPPHDNELDAELLMWWVHTRLDCSDLPDRRLVLEFRFADHNDWFWILCDGQGPSICTHDPGFGIDACIQSDLSTMYQVWLGRLPLRAAMREGMVIVTGTPAIVRRVPSMLELSPMADRVAGAPHQGWRLPR